MAPDAIEIHPGAPNVYYEQGVVKGEDTKPIMEKAAYAVEIDHLLQPPAASAPGARLRLRLYRRRRRADHPVQEHRPAPAPCHDRPGIGVEPEKLRLIQNPTGGTFGYKFSPTMEALLGVACMATGTAGFLVYDQFQNITYTGKRSPG